jgi:hypothetical protein
MIGGAPMSNIRETPLVKMAAMFNLASPATWRPGPAVSTAITVAAAATARIDAAARRRWAGPKAGRDLIPEADSATSPSPGAWTTS